MTGVNTTKQQTGEIKNNIKSNLVELNKVRKQPQRCSGKKDVLINSCSESCQGKFSIKILEQYLWRSSFLVKLHNLVSGSFYLRKKLAKNTIFTNFFIRWKPQGMRLKVADYQPATLLKMNFFIGIFQGFWLQISEQLFSRTPFKWLLLQRRIQDLVIMELFCEYNERLKAVNYFHKKAPS